MKALTLLVSLSARYAATVMDIYVKIRIKSLATAAHVPPNAAMATTSMPTIRMVKFQRHLKRGGEKKS